MNKEHLITFITNDLCPNCNSRSLVGISEKNENIYLDNEYKLNRETLVKLRCTKCNKEYSIDWRYDNIPKPFIV